MGFDADIATGCATDNQYLVPVVLLAPAVANGRRRVAERF